MVAWIMIGYVVATVFLLFAATFYLYWYSKHYDCDFNPNPWCWYDWMCLTAPDDSSTRLFPAQTLYGCGNDANGKPYPKRDASYCNDPNYPFPPGCTCMPAAGSDTINTQDPNQCVYGWDSDILGNCSAQLQSYGDNNPPKTPFCNVP